MARRQRRLVRHAGKVVTAAHAAKCVAKGFKGCSAAESKAVLEVVRRMAVAASRKAKR